jgi:hypothetical protein
MTLAPTRAKPTRTRPLRTVAPVAPSALRLQSSAEPSVRAAPVPSRVTAATTGAETHAVGTGMPRPRRERQPTVRAIPPFGLPALHRP